MEIATERLILRPLQMSDATAIRDLIFSDPEVAKGLAHDISRPSARMAFAEDWCRDVGIDGGNQVWSQGGMGGFAITAKPDNHDAFDGLLGVAGVYGSEQRDGRWNGEIFYALGRAFHGKRIMTEACAAIRTAFAALPGPGDLYAVYWEVLNPASGRILRRLGFADEGHKALLDEYDEERVLSLRDFELWRVRQAEDAMLPGVAKEAATKLGHLAREGLLRREEALGELHDAMSGRMDVDALAAEIADAFDRGNDNPGMAYLKFSTD